MGYAMLVLCTAMLLVSHTNMQLTHSHQGFKLFHSSTDGREKQQKPNSEPANGKENEEEDHWM